MKSDSQFSLGAPRQLSPSATPSVAMPLYEGVDFVLPWPGAIVQHIKDT